MSFNINGWVEDKDAIDSVESEVGIFGSVASFLNESGKDKIVCLHDACSKTGIEFPFTNQGNVGSCVACATSGANDVLKIVEISLGQREQFLAKTCAEHIYYVARVVVGKNRIRGDGAIVAYAIQGIANQGVLAMIKYPTMDLTSYSVERCRRWGTGSGYPKTLDAIAKEHTIGQFTRVKSYEECRDSIANGYPVIVGSKYGFTSETDNDGFCKYSTTWHHAMFIFAVDDNSKRKGCLIANSWPKDWLKIRKRKLNQPDGCFWVDAETIDAMMKNGDAWSIADFNGYKKKADMSVIW